MKKKLNEEQRKPALSIRLNPKIMKIVNETQINKSKYIEFLIYKDLIKNKLIDENFIL